MGIFNFYNLRKPRQYNHKPIYYDPRKEALEERVHKVKRELGVEETDYEQSKRAIKGSFIEGTTHLKKSKYKGDDIRNRVYKNMRLILILVLLSVIFWYFYLR
jgi:hypothetical protein